jgi:flavin-dependent dehydrogenase
MEHVDVAVIGAGLAGLQCARLLAGHGLQVLLVDRKSSLEQAIHTTGIFVRRSLDDFSLPPSCLGPPIRRVMLYSPARRALVLDSPHDEFRVAQMGALYSRMLKDCQAAGAQWLPSTSYLGATPVEGGSLVRLQIGSDDHAIHARYLVAADGSNSRVAADLGLSLNRHVIVGLEEVFEDVPFRGTPQLHCFLDRRIAPGYIAWIAEDGRSVHVGVGGYRSKFLPSAALDAFRASVGSMVDLRNSRLVERRGGRIPVGGILPNLISPRGLLIGDAAGAVSPLTAGGLDPCLRLSELAAKVVNRYLSDNDPTHLAAYDGAAFRRQFRLRRALRAAFNAAGYNPMLEVGCALLHTPPGRHFARRLFFGRGSFPDTVSAGATGKRGARLAPGGM